MIKIVSMKIFLFTLLFTAASSLKAQYPLVLDTTDSGVLKQCATVCLRISELQKCKTNLSFHLDASNFVDGISIRLYDFKSGATLDLNEEKRRAVVTVFDEITANMQTDSLVKFVEVEATQFNKSEKFAITKSDFYKMMRKQKVAEKYMNSFMAGDYKACHNMLDPTITLIFPDSLFRISCDDIVRPRGAFKDYTFIYFEDRTYPHTEDEFFTFVYTQKYAFVSAIAKYTIRKKEGDDYIYGLDLR
jgi:hypothetical protein